MIQVAEGLGGEIGVSRACQVLGVPRSKLYRARGPARPAQPRSTPERALSEEERVEVYQTINSERFWDCAPREVYASLLDEGVYLCHWRTMYRILEEQAEVQERRNQLQHPTYSRPELLATAPKQVWSWDTLALHASARVTKLRGPVTWTYYYLYVMLDIFSRYVVGWMIAECESSDLAEELIATTCAKERIKPEQLTLHSDRGSAMRSKTVGQLLVDLGVGKSFSRPYTANDNPYSEAQFKTLKYRPGYPDRFDSLDHSRDWARDFFQWYNHEHHHTGLGLMTPVVVHLGLADVVYAHREQVLRAAYEAHPERFVRGVPMPPKLEKEVWINRPQSDESAGPAPTPAQPCAQEVSRVPEGQAPASLDTPEHMAIVGEALDRPNWTEALDINFSLELSQNA